MSNEDTSLPESVKPEDVPVTESKTPAEAATPQADKPVSEPETSTGKSEAEPESRANARIRQLVDDKKRALAQAEDAKAQAELLRSQLAALQPKPAGDESNHPNQASFIKATIEEATIAAQRAAIEQQAQQAERLAYQSRERAYEARVSEFSERASDYAAVTGNPTLQITPLMADAIKESDNGPAVAYYLGKNPDEASRIARMSPVAQAAAIGRLEAKVSIPEKRTSSAPPPVKTVSGSQGTAQPDLADMSYEDYRKARMGK